MQDWITCEKAGELLGVSALEVARKIRKEIIPAERFGRSYKISRAEVLKYKADPHPRGNPKILETKIWEKSPHNTGNPKLFKLSPNWEKSQLKKRKKRRARKEKSA